MSRNGYASHCLSEVFPMMGETEYKELVASIRKDGYDDRLPIYLFEGAILDGRHRYKACEELGVAPVFTEFEGTFAHALLFVLRSNSIRRHLTKSQIAAAAEEGNALLKTRDGALEPRDSSQTDFSAPGSGKWGRPTDGAASQQEVAKTAGVSEKSIRQAKKVREADPELHQKVKAGEISTKAAEKIVRAKRKAEKKAAIQQEAIEEFNANAEKNGHAPIDALPVITKEEWSEGEYVEPLNIRQARQDLVQLKLALGQFAGCALELSRRIKELGLPYQDWTNQLNGMYSVAEKELAKYARRSKTRWEERRPAACL